MSFCKNCEKELMEGAKFCDACGAAVVEETVVEETVVEEVEAPAVNAPTPAEQAAFLEEKECLDNYFRLLKWERISWSISSKVFLPIAIFFCVFCSIFFIAAMASGEGLFAFVAMIYTVFPAMFFAFSFISRKMVGKVQYYMDTLYTDIRPTLTRSGSIGMLVFEIFFGTISPIFFIINFVRTKSNGAVTARIIAHQQADKAE